MTVLFGFQERLRSEREAESALRDQHSPSLSKAAATPAFTVPQPAPRVAPQVLSLSTNNPCKN